MTYNDRSPTGRQRIECILQPRRTKRRSHVFSGVGVNENHPGFVEVVIDITVRAEIVILGQPVQINGLFEVGVEHVLRRDVLVVLEGVMVAGDGDHRNTGPGKIRIELVDIFQDRLHGIAVQILMIFHLRLLKGNQSFPRLLR